MSKDLILTSIVNYSPQDLAPFVNSLAKSGYDGLKCAIVYPGKNFDETSKYLRQNDFITLTNDLEESIVIQRFKDYWTILSGPEFDHVRYVWAFDAKDVIFQSNLSEYIEKIGIPKLLVASEQIKYKNEDWGKDNFRSCYGDLLYNEIQENVIYNAGTIGGRYLPFKDLCLLTYLISRGQIADNNHKNNPDQAALNILLDTFVSDSVCFSSDVSAYAAQLGATLARPDYAKVNIGNLPVIRDDGIVTNNTGEIYPVVHQWDRVPPLRQKVIELYG